MTQSDDQGNVVLKQNYSTRMVFIPNGHLEEAEALAAQFFEGKEYYFGVRSKGFFSTTVLVNFRFSVDFSVMMDLFRELAQKLDCKFIEDKQNPP